MEQLLKGIHHFSAETFGDSSALFAQLESNNRAAPVLFITCADSGLLAERLVQNTRGQIYCASGLGTLVPPADPEGTCGSDSLAATLEFTIQHLQVGHIVVCGHSSCSVLAALLADSLPVQERSPLASWLAKASSLRDFLRRNYPQSTNGADLQEIAERECVLLSLEYLKHYPSVEQKLARGLLHLHGWLFHEASGGLSAYDLATGQFEGLPTLGTGRARRRLALTGHRPNRLC